MENISNFVTNNRRLRKKSQAKKKDDEYTQNEKNKRSYVNVVNSIHVNNINLSDMLIDLLKGEEVNSSKTDTSLPQVCTNSAQSLNHSRSLKEESDTLLYTEIKRSHLFWRNSKTKMLCQTSTIRVGYPVNFAETLCLI